MRASLAIAALVVSACSADLGKYVWVKDYQQQLAPAEKGFVLGPGDTIAVRMFGQEAFSTKAKIRNDGKISLPLLNDVEAAGYTPAALGQQLETRYKDFVKVPAVTVSVEDVRPLMVPVAGEVGHTGIITAERGSTLLQVLLSAGGLNDLAHKDRIFVLRGSPEVTRIRFTWDALVRGEPPAALFEIRAGDTVVVE